jgi:hypothetical protein
MPAIRKRVTEAVIEKYLCDQVKVRGGMCIKLNSLRGLPDRLVLLPGCVAHFVELKRPVGGTYEPLQLRTHERMRALGATVSVINAKHDVDKLLGATP